ncbi:hypothetical protein ABZ135_32675 [Streptomyces sp. NPDC006339]|uniref:hypothetical protein n=1 Tax=Streptomyces sp. NPDC006339 TaxID=3156755 RepID=UPI0033AE127B
MTTPTTRTATPTAVLDRAAVDQLIADLRTKQTGPDLAEQRHQFLEDATAFDYTRRTETGGER